MSGLAVFPASLEEWSSEEPEVELQSRIVSNKGPSPCCSMCDDKLDLETFFSPLLLLALIPVKRFPSVPIKCFVVVF